MESAIQPLIACLARLVGWPIASRDICTSDQLAEQTRALTAPFAWLDADGNERTTGLVCGPVELLNRTDRLRQPVDRISLATGLPVSLRLELGQCPLSDDDLHSLREGDVPAC